MSAKRPSIEEEDSTVLLALDDLLHDVYAFSSKLARWKTENDERIRMITDSDDVFSQNVPVDETSVSQLFEHYQNAVKEFSHRTTALALAFENVNRIRDCDERGTTALVKTVDERLNNIVTLSEHIAQSSQVSCLWRSEWLYWCIEIADRSRTLVISFKSPDSRMNVRRTATLWEACEAVPIMPKPHYVVKLFGLRCAAAERLVDDAIVELQGEGEFVDGDTARMKNPIIALCKCAKSTLRRFASISDGQKSDEPEDNIPGTSSQTETCQNDDKLAGETVVLRKSELMAAHQLDRFTFCYVDKMSEAIDDMATAYYEFDGHDSDAGLADSARLFWSAVTHLTENLLSPALDDFEDSVFWCSSSRGRHVQIIRDALKHNRHKLAKSSALVGRIVNESQ